MRGQVIQGFFVGAPIRGAVQNVAARPVAGPIAPASGGRTALVQPKQQPGPPAPAFGTSRVAVQAFGGNDAFDIDPVRLGLVRSGGSPLPQALLAKMEAAFGADFSAVRIHIGPQAARIGAIAFTTGNDLYFAPGRYQPDSMQGQQLIGHELAHVIQQREGRVRTPGSGAAVVLDRALEAEADRMGMRASMHRAPLQPKAVFDRVRHAPGPGSRAALPLQRMQSQPMESVGKRKRSKSVSGSRTRREPPSGYQAISTTWKESLRGKVDGEAEKEIYFKLYKNKVLLWWAYPLEQIDDFVYFGSRQDDIDDCDATCRKESGYIWHHTGHPQEEASGTMQLVPRHEHEALPHYGGIFLSKGN